MRIEIDGNDGTGKTSLVQLLSELGIKAQDRGLITKKTDNPETPLEKDTLYIILDASVETCQQRLLKAGKNLDEKYHTEDDLRFYRDRFREIAYSSTAILVQSTTIPETLLEVISLITGKRLSIGIPKGRPLPGLQDFLVSRELFLPGVNSRKYLNKGMASSIFSIKPRAIPQLVSLGMLDVGFCGKDIIEESIYENLVEVIDLGLNKVRIVAAAQDENILKNISKPLVVATEYPNLADMWLSNLGIPHITIESYGSTEGYIPNLADIILDVFESGKTLAANNLKVIESLGESSTVLVARKDNRESKQVLALRKILEGA